ncbi:hypothetical protein F5Y03DRAFT_347343 [Xylaria venustula]|nr:hypothetical protein F5Y03DRAFT_347343 [Xylaria venustula]
MGSASPPQRVTRSRAAAASSTAASLSPKPTKSDRVTKSTKASAAKKTTAAAAAAKKAVTTKKPVAAKKSATVKKSNATATSTTTSNTSITPPSPPLSSAPTTTKTTANTAAKSAAKATTSSTHTTVTTTAKTTIGKRKLRTYDNDDNEDDLSKDDDTEHTMNRPAKKLRGRAKKAADPEPVSDSEPESESQPKLQQKAAQSTTVPTRPTRGRPKKSTATSASSSGIKKRTPAAVSRTRTRKTTSHDQDVDQDDIAAASKQPAKKTTRGRRAATGTITTSYTTEPTPGLKSAVSRPASKVTGILKKTVTFEEPEKENMLPGSATKAKLETTETTATGLKAKPVRKATASGRTTRASARAATTNVTEKKPLSPKKDGQNRPLSRDSSSDDELATSEKTPLKPLMKSPIRPSTGVRKLELPPPEKAKDENSPQPSEPTFAALFGSPARRPTPSPFKNAMMSPAKRIGPTSGLSASAAAVDERAAESPTKLSMLQSPAKRPQMPLQAFQFNQEQASGSRSPLKMSLLSTPAKRPGSPMKLLGSPVYQPEDKPKEVSKVDFHTPTEEISEEELQSQIRAETGAISPPESAEVEKTLESIEEVENEDSLQLDSPTPQPQSSIAQPESPTPRPKSDTPQLEPPSSRLESSSPPLESSAPQLESSTPQLQSSTELESSTPQLDSPAPTQLEFPGRLSAVLPRHADPALKENPLPVLEPAMQAQTTPRQAAPMKIRPELRAEDLKDDAMSDSEDELAFSNKAITKLKDTTTTSGSVPVTPAPPIFKGTERKITESAARAASRAIRSVAKSNSFRYTPLSAKLSSWKASSPVKGTPSQQKSSPQKEDVEEDEDEFSLLDENVFRDVETQTAKGFFDDEMKIRADMEIEAAMEAYLEADIEAKFSKHDFHDLGITNEGLSIITEESEASLIRTPDSEQPRSHAESVSAASQEYGDENAVPIDPALVHSKVEASTGIDVPVTPKRPFPAREFHTVSKVPLKRGDDSPPRSFKRHCSTVSKDTSRRPSGPLSNVSLPSQRSSNMAMTSQTDQYSKLGPVTPSKCVSRPSVGTPARPTRPDLDPALLRGAVVFVDVHTTEGADAGRIFVDLLVQMGARCVKSWPWNPATTADAKLDTSKVGITHVVFKDGGKRTLEKVNESDGIVQCVGVSWVLDCEKENRWLDEKEYRVDTALIPRGGHNRRKSMEPKAVANMNGTLFTPMKANPGSSREPQTVPNNYMSRRDSTIWMRSPSEHDEEEDAPSEPSEMDWESTDAPILTPVPQTPAPEMVAKFAMDVTPGTPTGSFDASPSKNKLLMQTCPPKRSALIGLDETLVNSDQDQSVMMRLMAARRKSMQFAPKVASPLKKQWK